MIDKGVDISAVVTAHDEGRLAHRTIRSLLMSLEYAHEWGVSAEIIAVLDLPDEETENYFSLRDSPGVSVNKVRFGDPGLARNFGVARASGQYVAILDADDLVGKTWLYEAHTFLKTKEDIVAHPEYSIYFEAENVAWRQRSSSSGRPLADLIEYNYWTSICAAKRDLFLKHPYEATIQGPGFGHEDWHWNCQTLASGVEHAVVAGTACFVRKKKRGGSLSLKAMQHNRIVRPTRLFDPGRFSAVGFEETKGQGDSKNGKPNYTRNQEIAALGSVLKRARKFWRNFYVLLMSVFIPIFRSSPELYKVGKRLEKLVNRAIGGVNTLPEWLVDEWMEVHTIDPEVFPDRARLATIEHYQIPVARTAKYYAEFSGQYGDRVSHVFLVPWLKRGGADLEALNYVGAIENYQLGSGSVVIGTENTDSPWADKLPGTVRFIEFGKRCWRLSPKEQERLLARLLLQMAPHAIHNLNSDLGYRIFVKYGGALKNASHLYVNCFCKDVTKDGRSVGYPFRYLSDCFDHLTAVACDNQAFLDELRTIYAFELEKLFVHYQPMKSDRQSRTIVRNFSQKRRIDILWAGRMDRQKRPDLLEAIAVASQDLPFTFHVYGTPLLDQDISLGRLKRLSNVAYHGAFDGLSSIPTHQFDLYLYTSQWDGLPNVLLEAFAAGLPVIASQVGGVGELIVDGKTGYMVEPYDDVQAYVDRLKRIYGDRTQLKTLADNAYYVLESRHSWARFIEDLRRFPEYVVNRS
jgi:glycosyltransferase involved in cell wall biosynthesis